MTECNSFCKHQFSSNKHSPFIISALNYALSLFVSAHFNQYGFESGNVIIMKREERCAKSLFIIISLFGISIRICCFSKQQTLKLKLKFIRCEIYRNRLNNMISFDFFEMKNFSRPSLFEFCLDFVTATALQSFNHWILFSF